MERTRSSVGKKKYLEKLAAVKNRRPREQRDREREAARLLTQQVEEARLKELRESSNMGEEEGSGSGSEGNWESGVSSDSDASSSGFEDVEESNDEPRVRKEEILKEGPNDEASKPKPGPASPELDSDEEFGVEDYHFQAGPGVCDRFKEFLRQTQHLTNQETMVEYKKWVEQNPDIKAQLDKFFSNDKIKKKFSKFRAQRGRASWLLRLPFPGKVAVMVLVACVFHAIANWRNE